MDQDLVRQLVVGALGWVAGWFLSIGPASPLPNNILYVRPPQWLWFLCGFPQVTGLPKGVMRAGGVWVQLVGMLYGLCSLVLFRYWPIAYATVKVRFGLVICFIAASLLSFGIYKIWPYKQSKG